MESIPNQIKLPIPDADTAVVEDISNLKTTRISLKPRHTDRWSVSHPVILGKNDIAINQYEAAIDIEDEYRDQFREMYPEREEVVSRLGDKKYQFAKNRLKDLAKQSTP